ncbi:unnamed protein product, partial [Onchocerca flexuosa]|uniref:DUF5614 domain-containing protein n=1 Tax=Onchocerca flexuosa TaxID=387005 RepID=A0A183I7H7_9BILA
MEGIGKYKKKLTNEMKFLTALKDLPINEMKKYLDTSNITHLRDLLNVAKKRSCCAFYKSFAVPQRNVRGLAMDFIGASGSGNRSIIEQAQDYIEMAQIHLHFFKMPKIIFEFMHGVPDLLQHKLESFGIEVVGDTVDINEFVKLPVDFASSYDDDICDRTILSFLEHKCLKEEECIIDTVNLDIST